jgi:hypothetical protein
MKNLKDRVDPKYPIAHFEMLSNPHGDAKEGEKGKEASKRLKVFTQF